jgi:hypothetical protein
MVSGYITNAWREEPSVSLDQLSFLADEQAGHPPAPVTETIIYNRQKSSQTTNGHGRNELPAHLPRVDHVIEPDEDTSDLVKIAEVITEELEYTPPSLVVNRYIRPKYARPDKEGVIIGELPNRPIEKGIPGPGLLAHIPIVNTPTICLYTVRGRFLNGTGWIFRLQPLTIGSNQELKSLRRCINCFVSGFVLRYISRRMKLRSGFLTVASAVKLTRAIFGFITIRLKVRFILSIRKVAAAKAPGIYLRNIGAIFRAMAMRAMMSSAKGWTSSRFIVWHMPGAILRRLWEMAVRLNR